MRILALLLLVGLASASYREKLDDAANELLLSFLEGVQQAPSFEEYLGLDDLSPEALKTEDDIKTELGRKLKEGIEKILEKVKDAVDQGKEVRKEMIDKVKELRDKLREIKSDLGERSKELMKEVKEKARDYLKKLLKEYGLDKRSVDGNVADSELNIKDILRKLKEHLQKTVDPELLKEKIEKLFNQGSEILERILTILKEKGRRKLEIFIDLLLDDDEEEGSRSSRGIKDYWEKVKDYFRDLKIDLKEKYMKFGEWVKDVVDKGMVHSKEKMDNIKAIAKEVKYPCCKLSAYKGTKF